MDDDFLFNILKRSILFGLGNSPIHGVAYKYLGIHDTKEGLRLALLYHISTFLAKH